MISYQADPIVASGRELALLVFVEQQIEQIVAHANTTVGLVRQLRTEHRRRQQAHYQRLLDSYGARREWQAVRRLAQALLRRYPTDSESYHYVGAAALQGTDDTTALAALRRAVALGSHDQRLLYSLGEQYGKQGQHAEAVLAFRAAAQQRDAPPPDSRIQQYIQAEQHTVIAEAAQQQRPRGRILADNVRRLTYWQAFLRAITPATAAERALLKTLQRTAAARLEACVPLPELPAEPAATPAAQPQQADVPLPELPQVLAHTPAPHMAAEKAQKLPQPAFTPVSEPAPAPVAAPVSTSVPRATRPARPPFRWDEFWQALFSERMLHTILNVGALLVVISAFIWVAFNWAQFSPPVQLAALAGMTGTFYVSGTLIRRQGQTLSGTTLIAIGAAWVAVLGWAGARLVEFDPSHTWLTISLLCLPVYIATALWLRAYIFSLLSGLAAISTLLAALNVIGVGPPWQGNALLVLLAGYLLLACWLQRQPNGKPLAMPLVWLAHTLTPTALALAALTLLVSTSMVLDERLALALVWWLGSGFYLFALRLSGSICWEQIAAWIIPAALLLSAEATGIIPPAWYGTLLLPLIPAYLLVAHLRQAAYTPARHRWLTHRAAWPTYNTAYLLSLLALGWYIGTPAALLVNALGITALYAFSALLFRQPLWGWAACAVGLLTGWHFSVLLELRTLDDYVLLGALLGIGYWLVGVALDHMPRYGLAPLATGLGLLAVTLGVGFTLEPTTQQVLFSLLLVVSLVSIWLVWREQLFRLQNFVTRHRALLLAAVSSIAVALLPSWLELLLLPWSTALVIGVSKLLLATGYLLIGWGLQGSAWRLTRRMLTGAMAALTVLVVLPLPAGTTMFNFMAVLLGGAIATVPGWQRQLPVLPFMVRPVDGIALVGGLAALGLVPLARYGDDVMLLLALLGNTAVYFLATLLYRRASSLYAAAGTLTAAWLVGLGVWQVSLLAQGAWLAPLALLLCAAGFWLRARAAQLELEPPLYLYGYGAALVSNFWCVLAWISGSLATAQLAQGAVALGGLALLAIVSTLPFRWPVFAAWSVLLPTLAYLLVLGARAVPIERYGLALAGLAVLYAALVLLHKQRHIKALEHFRQPLQMGAHVLAGLALLGGVVDYLAGGSTAIAISGLLAGTGALAAAVLRRPVYVGAAALLVTGSATLTYITYLEPLLPRAGLALLWLGLAWGMVALGLQLAHITTRYCAPLYGLGLIIAALAPLWAVNDRPLLLAALGGLVVLCLYWHNINQRVGYELLTLGKPVKKQAAAGSQIATPAWQIAGLLYPVAVLVPFWIVLFVDHLGYSMQHWGLALALLAPVWLTISYYYQQPEMGWPFRIMSYALLPLALVAAEGMWLLLLLLLNSLAFLADARLTRTKYRWLWFALASPLMVILLVLNTQLIDLMLILTRIDSWFSVGFIYLVILLSTLAVCAVSAWRQQQPRWMLLAAAPILPLLALANSIIVIPSAPISWDWYQRAILYLLMAGGGLALAWWLDHKLAGGLMQLQRGALPSAYTRPLYSVAALCGVVTLGITAFTIQSFTSVFLLLAVVALWALYARRFYEPGWLYIAHATFVAPYLTLLDLLEVPGEWYGAALLPMMFASFALSYWLHQRTWPHVYASRRVRWFAPSEGLAWALPGYTLSVSGSLVALLLSFAEPWPLAIAAAGATLLYGTLAWLWRNRAWLGAALLTGHLGYAVTLHAQTFTEQLETLALLWLPLVPLTLGLGLWLERRAGMPVAAGPFTALQRLTAASWAQLWYLAALANMGVALLLALSLIHI